MFLLVLNLYRVYLQFSGFCLTTDVDNLLTHMNNARYLRELDFAKIDFNERTGLYNEIRKRKGSMVLGATTIRYRRFIRLFSRYYITSKVSQIYRYLHPTHNLHL